MAIVYENIIKDMGSEVAAFEDQEMFILFGDNAPDTLKDFCYIIDIKNVNKTIEKGQTLVLNGEKYAITAVGNVAEKNLVGLGHITVSFTGATEAALPGTIYVEQKAAPKLTIGSTISIIE